MPRPDVGHLGSTHCHLKAAPASFQPATSCWALHIYSSRATLSSHRASGPNWSTNWRGRPICLAPAPPTHHYIYISIIFVLCISFFSLKEIPLFWYYIWDCLYYFSFALYSTKFKGIQVYFFVCYQLALIYSYFLFSHILFFLKHVVSPISIRIWYHSGGTTSSL